MSQWKKDDSAANSVLWAPTQFKKAPTRAQANLLFGNTTANAYTDTAETIGMYGADTAEVAYDQWVLVGASVGTNRGNAEILLTGNATTGFQVNGGTASVNAIINVESLAIGTVGVNAAGQGYTNGDVVTIDGSGTGDHARFVVTANATGNVTAVEVQAGFPGDYSVFPNTTANTSNVSGSGNSLILDLTPGIGTLSVSNAGTFTVLPTVLEDNAVTEQADQANSNATVNLKFKKSTTPATHSGWVIVKQLAGNKAGRVQTETLVATGSMTGDAEDSLFPNT